MSVPTEVVRAFAGALEAGDAEALEALCTEAGWRTGGNSVGRFVKQALRGKLRFLPLGEFVEEDRRAAICGLLRAADSGRQHGRLWLHAVNDGGWLLEGVSKQDRASALFVSGILPAIFDATTLPPSPAAATWVAQVVRDALEDPATISERHGALVARGLDVISDDVEGVLADIGTHRIEAIGRHVAGIGRRHGPDDVRQRVWFALDANGHAGELRVVGHSFGPGSALVMLAAGG